MLGSFDAVTSLVDFYGFRHKGDKTINELEEDLTRQIRQETRPPLVSRQGDSRMSNNTSSKGLLFSDVSAFANAIDVPEESVEELRRIREEFPTPEDINDNSDTAPSKRIVKEQYRGTEEGR